jgi:hypothetical protein
MAKACVVTGRITSDGHTLTLPRSERRKLEAAYPRFAGERVELELRAWKSKRTSAQNARYWALLTVAALDLWGDPSLKDTLHEELAQLLLGLPPCPKTGLRRRQRTPRLNTKEFARYTDLVADKLVELGADLSGWDEEITRQETP